MQTQKYAVNQYLIESVLANPIIYTRHRSARSQYKGGQHGGME